MSELLRKEVEKELESFDPDELVSLLGLTSGQILRAFPGHVEDYARQNVPYYNEDGEEVDVEEDESGISIYS